MDIMIETLFKSIAKKYSIENVFSICEERTGPIAWFVMDESNMATPENSNIKGSDELTRDANKRSLNNILAYYLDPSFPGRESNIPIIAYGQCQIDQSGYDSELIIIHEICHLIEMRNISENSGISLTEKDKQLSNELAI